MLFGNENNKKTVGDKIIDDIVFRCWVKPKCRKTLGSLMSP